MLELNIYTIEGKFNDHNNRDSVELFPEKKLYYE